MSTSPKNTNLRNSFPCVLLVEDNLTAQKIAKSLLTSLICEVDIAECGEKAIELFESGKYDLIFMDIGLPDISGSTVAKRLRKMEKNQDHAMIVALTAHAPDDKQSFFEAGIDDVITKPLSNDQTKKIIARCIRS